MCAPLTPPFVFERLLMTCSTLQEIRRLWQEYGRDCRSLVVDVKARAFKCVVVLMCLNALCALLRGL